MSTGLRILLSFFGGAVLAVALVAGTIYAVDPFGYFRWRDPPHLASLMQRHSTAAQIRNTDFDTIVLGNSTAARLNQPVFDRLPDRPRVGNLSMWGATLEENAIALKLALGRHAIRRVIWLVGNQQLTGYRSDDFPKCMYDERFRFLPYCYIFNMSIFQEAVEFVLPFLDYEDKPAWRTDLQTWKSYQHVPMNVPDYICDLYHFAKLPIWERKWQSADFGRLDWTDTDVSRAYDRLVFPLVDAHPEVEFVFVFPPMYRPELVRFVYQNADYAMYYMSLIEQGLLPRRNVQVFDFRFSELTRDPQEYLDAAHFSETISDEMLAMIASGQHRVVSVKDDVRDMVAETEAAVRDFREDYRKLACGG
jgi:hypothetical protein